jgi:UDP-N-acetylmuramoylalanine--D-glutamate ligase
VINLKILLLGHGIANDGCKRLLEYENIKFDYFEINEVVNTYDLIVKSPGISLFNPFFNGRSEEVISDIELAYRFRNIYTICITGTNGKTTVASMIYHILKDNCKTVLCGNIGYSICDAVIDNGDDAIYVVEASSFQLESTVNFDPDIMVILNINPHHLDHHKTLEHYVKSKLKPAINTSEDKYTIYSLDSPYLSVIKKNNKRNLISFSKEKMISDVYLFDGFIYYRNKRIYRIKKGTYSYVINNYMAVIGVLSVLNLNVKKEIRKLKHFKNVKYRMEKLTNNIYNDAKSTNQYSTIAAISNLDNVLLICGGYDRGERLVISNDILSKIICVFAYGDSKGKIKKYMNEKNVNCLVYDKLVEAFDASYQMLDDKKTLLYSPMFASYDQYKSFEKRGYEFEELVLKKKSLFSKK